LTGSIRHSKYKSYKRQKEEENTMTIRARFRVAGITWEQAIVAFLTKYPGSTAEEVNDFAQHPDLKNFSTILSAMKRAGHLTRDKNRPTRWTVKSTHKIPVPEMVVTKSGPSVRASSATNVSVPMPHVNVASHGMTSTAPAGGGNLVAIVQDVLATEQAAKMARSAFDALLPGLDEASKTQLFNMLAKTGNPIEIGYHRPTVTPMESTDGRSRKRSSDEIQSVVHNIVGLLRKAPDGLRAEQIRDGLGVEAKELPRPLQVGLDMKSFRKRGMKRSTTYFLAPPKWVTPKKGTTKAKTSKKSSSKDESKDAADVAPSTTTNAASVEIETLKVETTPSPVRKTPEGTIEMAFNEPDVEVAAPKVEPRTVSSEGDEKLVFEAVRSFGVNSFKLAEVCERIGLSSTVVQPLLTKFRKEGLIAQSRDYTIYNREWVNVTEKKSQKSSEVAA
jgi:hypothetical protein